MSDMTHTSEPPRPGPPYHVFPTSVDMLDTWHGAHGRRVRLPQLGCALCQLGLCVQFELEHDTDIVMHGRWSDG